MRRRTRRLLDLALGGGGLVITAPIWAGAAAAIWLEDGGPVLFRQQRVGLGGEPFAILKFRTMIRDADRAGAHFTTDRDPRITQVGAVLRATKLDELPQLVNVMRGEMGLVGPRPESLAYFERYDEASRELASVLPGITDPSSIAFRWEGRLLEEVADPDRFYWEVMVPAKVRTSLDYARRATLRSDLRVLAQTLLAVLDRSPPPSPEEMRARYAPDAPPEAATLRSNR